MLTFVLITHFSAKKWLRGILLREMIPLQNRQIIYQMPLLGMMTLLEKILLPTSLAKQQVNLSFLFCFVFTFVFVFHFHAFSLTREIGNASISKIRRATAIISNALET